MNYEELFSRFYSKKTDPTFFTKYTKDEAYELMKEWMHDTAALPHVQKCFSSIVFNDEIFEMDYVLDEEISINQSSDDNFVKNIFSQGLKICWMTKQIDTATSLATVIGGKEEKRILSNYKQNIDRLETLERKLEKTIRNKGYYEGNIGEF